MALRGVAGHVNTATANSITVTYAGAAIQAGDIIVLGVLEGGSTSAVFTPPSGFTAAPSALQGVSGTTFDVFTKTAVGGETTFVVSSTVTDYMAAHVRVYSGRSGTITTSIAEVLTTSAVSPTTFPAQTLVPAAGDDVLFIGSLIGAGGWGTIVYSAGAGFANANKYTDSSTSNFENGICGSDYVNNPGGSASCPGGSYTFTAAVTTHAAGYFLSLAQGAATSRIDHMLMLGVS